VAVLSDTVTIAPLAIRPCSPRADRRAHGWAPDTICLGTQSPSTACLKQRICVLSSIRRTGLGWARRTTGFYLLVQAVPDRTDPIHRGPGPCV